MRHLRELALWAGAALGLLSVAAGLAVVLGGYSFLLFRSGSMSPEIPTGAIALSQTVEAADIEAGDVVSVTAANGQRITHRVVSSTLRGDEASLVLKGDANATADSEIYVVTEVERVVASVPHAGYVVAHLLTPPGLVAVACLSLMLVLLGFGGARDDDDETDEDDETGEPRASGAPEPVERHTSTAGGVVLRGVTAVAVLGVVAAAASTNGTLARFTDNASAASGPSSATSIAVPVTPTVGAPASGTVRVTWTATPVGPAGLTATSYDVLRYPTASGGTPVAVCQGVTVTSCDAATGTGAAYFAVRARYGAQWLREGARQAYAVTDTTPPTVTIQTPLNTCGAVACGTASDAGGGTVAKVEYTLRRVRTERTNQANKLYACWINGQWTAETPAVQTCTFTSATGTTSWTVPGTNSTAYQNNGRYQETFELGVRATDSSGNVSAVATGSYVRS